jgi:hypothetical protein
VDRQVYTAEIFSCFTFYKALFWNWNMAEGLIGEVKSQEPDPYRFKCSLTEKPYKETILSNTQQLF